MIARIWHGTTLAANAAEYMDYLNVTGIPDYQSTPGNRAVYVLQRIEDNVAHFLTISIWDSLDSIKEFAGKDIERARYYPEDENFLLALEPNVIHYEVLAHHTGKS